MMTDTRPEQAGGRPPLSPGRRVALALGVLVSLAVVAAGAFSLIAWLTPKTTVEQSFTMSPQTSRLSVDVGSGSVRLTHGTAGSLEVHRSEVYTWREPTIEERTDGSGASIVADCSSWFGFSCSVDYEIAVPDGFTVELNSSSGDLSATGITVDRLRAEASSGELALTDVTGPVELQSSSGSINATRLTSSTVAAKVSSGDVALDFDTAPSNVSVEASSGDVTLELPTSDGAYRVNVDTSSGDRSVNVPTDPNSPRSVTVDVSSGDVQLLAR